MPLYLIWLRKGIIESETAHETALKRLAAVSRPSRDHSGAATPLASCQKRPLHPLQSNEANQSEHGASQHEAPFSPATCVTRANKPGHAPTYAVDD